MVQGMAAQSGGRLILSSEPGHGTTAELWLPVAQTGNVEERQPSTPAGPALAAAPPALTILTVDDDPLVLANTAAMLEDLSHTVLLAPSGAEALAMLQTAGTRIDLLITDQAMPGMTGLRLAQIVSAELPQLPILLVTGYAELPPGTEAQVSKLRKPFDQAALAKAIAELVLDVPEADIIMLRPGSSQPTAA
jgi:CheY-like chemotaxis protein